ncbi:MAG: sigma-70 family RNA polymerase sigma factor [Planctomycetota bacterium]
MADTSDNFSTAPSVTGEGEPDGRARFARVFAQHDRWLYAYLVSLLGSSADAEEVFQEVCVVLWRDYEKFDPDTSFVKWASVVAHYQVQRYRRTLSKQAKTLSDEVVDLLASEAAAKADLMDSRRHALHDCLKKLRASDLELVRHCYADGRRTMKLVAESLGRPVNTVYKAMNRVRKALHDCIDRTLAAEGLA